MERSAAELIQARRFPHESCARRGHFAVKHNATVLRARSEKFARHSEPGAPNFGYPQQNVEAVASERAGLRPCEPETM